jgi:hypothetical protein
MGRRKLYHTRRKNLGTYQRACDLADVLEETLKYKDLDAYISLDSDEDDSDYKVMYLCWLEEYSEEDYQKHKESLKRLKKAVKEKEQNGKQARYNEYLKLKAEFE